MFLRRTLVMQSAYAHALHHASILHMHPLIDDDDDDDDDSKCIALHACIPKRRHIKSLELRARDSGENWKWGK